MSKDKDAPKYEILYDNYMLTGGRKLYRIKALKDFTNVSAGTIGGWVEFEHNLDQKGDCWISDDAQVTGNAVVREKARIFRGAHIFDNVQVSGSAKIFDHCNIGGNVKIYDKAELRGHVRAFGDVEIYGDAMLDGFIYLHDTAKVLGNTIIKGYATVRGPAYISSNDYVTINNVGSENGTLTAFKNESGEIYLNRGCFTGSISQFVDAVKQKHGDNKHSLCYDAAVQFITQMLTN